LVSSAVRTAHSPTSAFAASSTCWRTRIESRVLCAALTALSHHRAPSAIGPVSRFRRHADADIRHAVVHALTGIDDSRAIGYLIELSADPAIPVRDWATFGLGSQTSWDTPELRTALFHRLVDEDSDTRREALVGLAGRRDSRIIPALCAEHALDDVGNLAVEAAALVADPRLLPLLRDLRESCGGDDALLDEVIRACSRSTEPME
jgi:HEAT repeat protein